METFSALLAICAGNSPAPVNSPHKGQWRGALMFTLICARINGWVNNREAGDLRRYRTHYDVIVMCVIDVACHRKVFGNGPIISLYPVSSLMPSSWWRFRDPGNTLRPKRNGCHSADDFFKCIFLHIFINIYKLWHFDSHFTEICSQCCN